MKILPPEITRLADYGHVRHAEAECDGVTELLALAVYCGDDQLARERAHELLDEQLADDPIIYLDGDQGIVETRDFYGVHPIVSDHHGQRPVTEGSYVHTPTDFGTADGCADSAGSATPNPDVTIVAESLAVEQQLRTLLTTEAPDVAARTTYQRSRL
jgi:hypothetical protein